MQEHTSWYSIFLKESTISFQKLSTVLLIFSFSYPLCCGNYIWNGEREILISQKNVLKWSLQKGNSVRGERQAKGAQAVLNSAPFRFNENLMLTSVRMNTGFSSSSPSWLREEKKIRTLCLQDWPCSDIDACCLLTCQCSAISSVAAVYEAQSWNSDKNN